MQPEITGSTEETVVVAALQRVIGRNCAHSLVASDGISERIFYFSIGGIRVIRSGPRKTSSLGEILAETGKLSSEDVLRVVSESNLDGQLFGETALALGLLQQADIDEALQSKVQDEVLDLFLWDGAEIHLQEGQPPKSFYEGRFEAARISCDVPTFLQAVLARVDEWRGVLGRLPNGREVYEASDETRTETHGGPHARLVGFIDGTRTASDAINRSGMRRVSAFELLLEMLRTGKIRRVASQAAQKISRDELVREIEALEDALKVNADATVVRARLARALQAAGENARAASQWRFLGDRYRRENNLDRAMECYRSCVGAVPTDFATRELILEIHRHKRDYGQLVADGRPLADLFLKHNLLNRAKNLLLQLVGLETSDTALRRQLVMVLIGLGERDLALKHLRDLARILEQRHAPVADLRDVYVRILALDKKDAAAQDRLDTITGAKFQRRILRATLAVTGVVLLSLGGWFVYEGRARRVIGDAVETAKRQIDAKDYDGAKKTLRESVEQYGSSRGAATALNMLDQLERYEREERQRAGQNADLAKTPAERAEAAAQAIVDRARELTIAGRTDEAYRSYRELFEVFGGLRVVESVSLPLEVTVLPLDAHVLLAGEEIGQGVVVVQYSPHAKCTLAVELEGYVPFKRVLDGPQDAALTVSLEKATRWTYASDAALDSQPLCANGMVYVAGRDRYLTALSALDGAVQWRTPLGFSSDSAVRPVATEEGVFVATATGDAVCVNGMTGDVLWRRSIGAAVDRQPVPAGQDSILVAANDGSLRALTPGGETRWTLAPGTSAAPPVALGGEQFAYVDAKGGLVYASVANGLPLPGYTQPAVLRGTPVSANDRLWAMADDNSLRTITASTRRPLKRFAVPGATESWFTVEGDTAFAVGGGGFVLGFRVGGGESATVEPYFRVKLDEPASAAPAVRGGTLYVPGQKGRLAVYDVAKEKLLWRFDAKARITAPPVFDNGTFYVVTSAGRLFAVTE